MDVRGTEIATASLFAVPVPVLLVLGNRTNENGIAMQRKRFFAASLEMHRAATGPAVDVGNSRHISDLRLTALASQDRCVTRDRRYNHDAHVTDIQTTAQEMCMGIGPGCTAEGALSSSKRLRSPSFFEAVIAQPAARSAERALAKHPSISSNRHPGVPREGAKQALEKTHGSCLASQRVFHEHARDLVAIDLHPVRRVLAAFWILIGPHGHSCLSHRETVFGIGVRAYP